MNSFSPPPAWLHDRVTTKLRDTITAAPFDGPPANFEMVMDGCRFMQHVRDDAATLREEDWFIGVSIAAQTENGIDHAHELSAPYPRYDFEQTQRRAERALAQNMPHTCERIEDMTDGEWCRDCPNRGKIKSPLVAGRPRLAAHDDRDRESGNGAADEKPGLRLDLVSLADVEPQEIEWEWDPWLARRKLHILAGHPGDGKSTLMTAIAAALSRGRIVLPGGSIPAKQGTLFLLGEDSVADTLRPRLDQNSADVTMIDAVRAAVGENGRRSVLSLDKHLDLIRDVLKTGRYGGLIVDPLTAFMPKTDRNSEGDVRDVLTPLADVADDTGVWVVAIMHIGKGSNDKGRRLLQQILGATAFGAAARVVWMNAEIPDTGIPPKRILQVVKSNIGLKPAPLEWSRELDGPVVWHGESERDIEDILQGVKVSKLEIACDFLRRELANGARTFVGLMQAAKSEDISEYSLRRAQKHLGVNAIKPGGEQYGPWMWELPKDQDEQNDKDHHLDQEEADTGQDGQISLDTTTHHLDQNGQDEQKATHQHLDSLGLFETQDGQDGELLNPRKNHHLDLGRNDHKPDTQPAGCVCENCGQPRTRGIPCQHCGLAVHEARAAAGLAS